jgi:hypothetical protein
MHFGKAIGIAIILGAPFCAAQGVARPAAEAQALRTFTIVAAKPGPARAQFDRVAKLVSAQLEKKGYRIATPGQIPDMTIKLRFGGTVLRYRAADLGFVSSPMAINTASPSEPYPYPSGAAFGPGQRPRALSWSPAALELYVAVEISSGAGQVPLFQDGVRKKIAPQSVDRASAELVEAALEKFPAAKD